MPQTRAQKEQTGLGRVAADPPAVAEGHHQNAPPPPPGPPRQRKAAKSKTHAGSRNLRRSISTPTLAGDQEEVFFDDEENDVGKTLHSKDGKLGFFDKKGFIFATNFLVDIQSQVFSERYSIKGYEVMVRKAGCDEWVDFFIPESDIYSPVSFKQWLDLAHLRTRWKLTCNGKSWRDMIEKRLDHFEETRYKEKMLVEKIGVQTQTSSQAPFNLELRRACIGPNLYFKADGSIDENPIHYFGNGTLSVKLGAPKMLKALKVIPDESMDLTALIEAYMPGNFWQHCGTAALIMSCSNADAVRMKAKQHPCPVLLGPMGIGKSSCQDVCMWQLCGSREVSKIDSDTRNTTVKRLAALKTFPTTIEDNSSENKEENLTNACYDSATYHVRGEEVCIETPFLITTNLESRSERAGDREDLILFEVPSVSPEEMIAAENKYDKAMHQKTIPIGATIKYGSFVLGEEFGELLARFTAMQMELNGCKKRTARGYALKDVAVFYIMRTNPEVFSRLGHNWDGDEDSYLHYIRTKQKQMVKTYHMELTRAGPICIRYLENAIQLAESWEMTQRLRNFAIVVSKKHRDWRKCKYCVAVKVDCPFLINCGGVTMELVQKVIGAIGGVNNAVCASFLSQLEVYDEEVGLVAKQNTQQHRCVLFPIANFLNSALILKIASVLENPNLCQLADEETPTSTSGNLGTSGNAAADDDDERENYNDISMLLQPVNSPINSTQVDHSTSEAGSHHNLELSRIESAGASLPARAVGGTTAAMSSAAQPPTPCSLLPIAAALPTLGSLLPTAAPPPSARDLTSLIEEDMILTSITANETSNPQGVYRCKCGKECTSTYGLTRHREKCDKPPAVAKLILFSCPDCQRTFGEQRYLKQHIGGRKCQQRKALLQKTASFSLALTESPASSRNTSSRSSPARNLSSSSASARNISSTARSTSSASVLSSSSMSNLSESAKHNMIPCGFCHKLLQNLNGLGRHLNQCKVRKAKLAAQDSLNEEALEGYTIGECSVESSNHTATLGSDDTDVLNVEDTHPASNPATSHTAESIGNGAVSAAGNDPCIHCGKFFKKKGLGSHMKHCPQRPPNLVSAALPGTTTNTAPLSGTTTDIVDLPGRRLSVSLNSVPSQDHHKEPCIFCGKFFKKNGLGSHMKHCSQRPPNLTTTDTAALPGTTTATVDLPETTTDTVAVLGTTTDIVAVLGTTTDTVAVPGTTTEIVDLPGRRLSVSLNPVPSQENHQDPCIFCGKLFKKKGIASHMKHCRLRPLNSASEPHGTTATAPVAFPATTDPVAFTGSTDPVAVPGTTDTVALPRRRLSVSLNSVPIEENPNHQCPKCSNTYRTIQALSSHKKFCRGRPSIPVANRRLSTTLPAHSEHVCTVCGDTSSTPTGLKVHLLSHRK